MGLAHVGYFDEQQGAMIRLGSLIGLTKHVRQLQQLRQLALDSEAIAWSALFSHLKVFSPDGQGKTVIV